MAKKRWKKVWGFVLHFGYVESSRVAPLILHHAGPGFDDLREAVSSLAHEFLRDYLAGIDQMNRWNHESPVEPSLDDFQSHLYQLVSTTASGDGQTECFLSNLMNDENWWAWDPLSKIAPHLAHFYEIIEKTETFLPNFIDPKTVEHSGFRAELEALHVPPDDPTGWHVRLWKDARSLKRQVRPVVKTPKA